MPNSEYDSSPPESFSSEDSFISDGECSDSDTSSIDPFVINKETPGICTVLGFDNSHTQYGDLFNYFSLLSTFTKLNFQIKSFYGHPDYRNILTNELIMKHLSETDYSTYSCFALFVLNGGTDECLNGCDTKIIEHLTQNETLKNIPKLIFLNGSWNSDNFSADWPINLHQPKFPKNTFVCYSSCPGHFFIRKLCYVLAKYSAYSDLKSMVAFVIRCTNNNFSSIKDAPKSPIFNHTSDNLTQLVIFGSRAKVISSHLGEKGRIAIFNYDNNNKLDLDELKFVYRKLFKYKCITYNCPKNVETKTKLKEESKNVDCDFMIILIYATCDFYRKTFKTKNNYVFNVDDMVKMFEKNNSSQETKSGTLKSIPKYIFINSITNCEKFDYEFKQDKNICISFNMCPVNFAIQLISTFNYPTKFSKLFPDSNVDTAVDKIQQSRLLFEHFTNSTIDETSDKSIENKISQRFNDYFYKSDNCEKKDREFGVKSIIGIILGHQDANEQIDLIKNYFMEFHGIPLNEDQSSINDIKKFFKEDISKPVDCLFLFIFAHCNSDMIKIGDNKQIKIDKLINYLCKGKSEEALKEKPKLIFIQNLSNNTVTNKFDLQDDFLLVINPANNQSEFFKNFCDLLNLHSSEYDLLSILLRCNMMSKYRLTYIRSTLTKCLFLKSRPLQHELDCLQSRDLFYRTDKKCDSQKCLFMMDQKFINDIRIKDIELPFSYFYHCITVPIDNKFFGKMISGGLEEYFNESGFFAIIILDNIQHDLIERLIEYLVWHEALLGKPKILLLFGSLVTGQAGTSTKKDVSYTKKMKNDFILPKHADIMVFHCEQILQASESIRKIFVNENVEKYDLTNLLTMLSADIVNPQIREKCPKETVNTSDVKLPALPYIHSTLTRLVSLQQSEQDLNAHFQLPETIYTLPQVNRGICVIFCYEKFKDPQLYARNGHQNDVQTMRKTFGMLRFEVKVIGDLDEKQSELDKEQNRLDEKQSKLNEEQSKLCDKPSNEKQHELNIKQLEINKEQIKLSQERSKLIEERELGLEQSQLTKEQTMLEVENIQCDGKCLVLCFMTHGNDADELACYDGQIRRDDILNSIAQNEKLKGKLKIFLFQACRGVSVAPTNKYAAPFTDMVHKPNSALTIHPDMFIFFSTFEGHKSIRNTDGSWFIQNLCKILRENYNRYDLFTIAALVCRAVSLEDLELQDADKKNAYCLKAIPTFCTTFTRSISFEWRKTNDQIKRNAILGPTDYGEKMKKTRYF